jgi:hypothetical protein
VQIELGRLKRKFGDRMKDQMHKHERELKWRFEVGEHVQVTVSVHDKLMHACTCLDLARKWLVNKSNGFIVARVVVT